MSIEDDENSVSVEGETGLPARFKFCDYCDDCDICDNCDFCDHCDHCDTAKAIQSKCCDKGLTIWCFFMLNIIKLSDISILLDILSYQILSDHW